MRLKATVALVTILVYTASAQTPYAALQQINTAYNELCPVVSPDGRTLFITIANHPQNIGGRKDPGDIWFCVLTDNNQWSAPVHAGPVLNDRAYNGVAGFSADASEMYLLSHYSASGEAARTQGIAVSRNTGNGWSRPENISIPYFQNKSGITSGFMLADRSVYIFSAETYGTFGVEDLYVSTRKPDGQWAEPKNLGSRINTQFQELSPSLSPDGRTLYFSSNGRKGNGSFDVYSASRLDDTWTNWSEPVNMGANINSEGRELFYRIYPNLGFSIFTSTKNSDVYGDIRIYRPDEPFPKDTVTTPAIVSVPDSVKINEIDREPADGAFVNVHGKVVNAKNGEGVHGAKVTFTGITNTSRISGNPVVTNGTSGYSLRIPSTDNYTVRIEAAGFISAMEKLDIKTYEMKELEMNFSLQPIEVGTTVNLKSVLFEQSKTTLLPGSYAELDVVVAFLEANPNVKIELSGHTDNRGIPAQNVKLSQARVDKVKSYLVSKGISPKRIYGKGYGGGKPIASNDTEETRQLNRRVEFTIKKL
jgi:outer membrane protein OmpA-like peptidoglycan-associated protein